MGSPHVSKVTQIALEYAHNVQRTHKLRDPYMAGGPMHRDPGMQVYRVQYVRVQPEYVPYKWRGSFP